VVNLDDIMTIPKTLLENRTTMLSGEKTAEIELAVRFALDPA
jgi:mRNA-degrading endonuclease toxin of MazEF toxin-antitoxin module